MSDEKAKPGFLFHIISDVGNGHQVQATFNLPEGASKADINAVYDKVFDATKRQAARLRIPTIEMEIGMQAAKVEGIREGFRKLRETPVLVNGRKRTIDETAERQAETQLDADTARLELLKKNLSLTQKEAELPIEESPCLIQRAN